MKIKRPKIFFVRPRLSRICLLALTAIWPSTNLFAWPLEIDCHGFDASEEAERRGLFEPRSLVLVIGSEFSISIGLRPCKFSDMLRNGQLPAWPAGIRFEAGDCDSATKGFRPVPNLINKLNLQFYETFVQTQAIEWLAQGKEPSAPCELNFLALAPDELQGKTIYVRAVSEHPTLGSITSRQAIKLTFIAPRDSLDLDRVRTSLIEFAQDAQKRARAVEIADSLIALGYHDVRGLHDATVCAQRISMFDKAIEFLDLNYQANGKTSDMEPPSTPYSERATKGYNLERYRLLQLKAEQEQGASNADAAHD